MQHLGSRRPHLLPALLLAVLLAGPGCAIQPKPGDPANPLAALLARLLPKSTAAKRQELLNKLSSPDADLRRQGVVLLGQDKSADPDVAGKILTILAAGDVDPQVRAAAVEVHTRLNPDSPNLPELLAKAARDASPLVREEAIRALARRGDPDSLTLLAAILGQDPQENLRAAAAVALANYRSAKAIQSLINALDDEAFHVVYRARQSLQTLSGRDLGYDPAAWQDFLAAADSSQNATRRPESRDNPFPQEPP